MKGSDKPTCGDHGGHNKRGEPCARVAGWGTDFEDGKCKWHRGTKPDGSTDDHGAPEGNQNARKHGAFSDHFRSDLTETEAAALDGIMDHLESIDDERTLAAEIAGEALLKYKRSADSRFLREARQWIGDFNLLPNEDSLEVSGSGGGALNVLINREEVE